MDSTTITTNNHFESKDPLEHKPPRSPLTNFSVDSEEDTMPYPYPPYNDESDGEAHICTYLTTWQVNHASKRLGMIEANISKIAEFGLFLDDQAASWYSQNNIMEFADFDHLWEQFIKLFH